MSDPKDTSEQINVNINANDISGQVAVGNNITQVQNRGKPQQEASPAKEQPVQMSSSEELFKLHQILSTLFNESELRDLCFNLGIDYENLPGVSKPDKARELVVYFQRRDQLANLISVCQKLRPNAFA